MRNLSAFRRFVRLCAGRVGQVLNLSALGSDAGVFHTTARNWLTLLEASYTVFLLPPFHANLRKRLIKPPKLYFYDVGLASCLIGIEHSGQVAIHPLRGQIFENAVVIEALKHRFNRGLPSNLLYYRDTGGLECDLLCALGSNLGAIESKAGSTVASDFSRNLNRVQRILPQIARKAVIHDGDTRQQRKDEEAVPLPLLPNLLDSFSKIA